MMTKPRTFLLVLFASAAISSTTAARPGGDPPKQATSASDSPDARSEAQRLYAAGNERFVERDYTEALTQYLAALEKWDHAAIRFNIAECYVSLVQPLKAFEHLEKALEDGPDALESELHYQRGQQLRKNLLAQLGRVRLSTPHRDAVVTLDGKEVDLSPDGSLEIVLPGGHQVVTRAAGFITNTRTVVLSPGETIDVRVELEPVPPPTVTRRRWPRWVPWAVTGAGASLMLVGLPVMQSADSSYEAYDRALTESCAPPNGCAAADLPAETRDLESSGDTKRLSAQALWAVGGATVATGLVIWLLNQPRVVEQKKTSLTVGPSFHPGGAGVVGTWSF